MPKWHAGSIFGSGLLRPLTRDDRARFRFLVTMHHRAGRLTRCARDVAEALLRRLGVEGRLDPTHDTLADDAACDARTVRRALAALRDLGLVQWCRRLVRDGWGARQTSNAYELLTSAKPPVFPSLRYGGQRARGSRDVLIQPSLPLPAPAEATTAQAALADRRRVMEQRLLTGRLAGRSGAP